MSAAPYCDSWREKLRQAINYRWRQARRDGAVITRMDLEQQQHLDDRDLIQRGLECAAAGCPTCGGLLDLGRLALRVIDRTRPPVWPSNLQWTMAPCPSCRRAA